LPVPAQGHAAALTLTSTSTKVRALQERSRALPEFLLPLSALPYPQIDPVILEIGPLAIRWYGLGYVVGILFGWWYARRLAAAPHLWAPAGPALRPSDIDDFVVWATLGIILGGRLGYVLFYDLPRFLEEPLAALAVWEGGMSFHGGLVGVVAAMILFAHRRGIRVWSLFDVIAAGVPVGIGLVRIANFINGELWGRPSDVPWAMVFPGAGPLPRHPSQLYEAALEGLLLFIVLQLLVHRAGALGRPGLVSGAFAAGYGVARMFVEFFREPDAHIGYLAGGWLTMGMVLSAPMLVIGVLVMIAALARARPSQP
jgi:phosphatidylglycerol:prolipoprotein diacylglycerol transferase